jgi:uncharacterized protein with HEPN domain
MRTDRLRLQDALEQIELIRQFAAAGQDAFLDDLLTQSALLHKLTLLGEACRALSPELQAAHPEVPWAQIIAFRNVITHQYFGLDLELVWSIIDQHVPVAGAALEAILRSIGE